MSPSAKPAPYAPSHQSLPNFFELAPNVWVPIGYDPGPYELPTPIVRTVEEAAAEHLRCAGSLSHFLFSHCWTLHVDDPSGPTYRKFPAFPYLRTFADNVQTPANTHCEKSRQMLMSWAWMAVFLWDILFHDRWANLAISRLETLVDDGGEKATTDSLFGKLLVLWRGLPPYLQYPLEFQRLIVRCPTTGSYIKGQSAESAAGRGPAYNRALWDEAAHSSHSHTLFTALQQAAKRGLILNSTPLGKNNEFARIRFDKRTNFKKMTMLWIDHPDLATDIYCECGWAGNPASPVLPGDQYRAHACVPTADPREKPRRHARSPTYDRLTANYTQDQTASEFDLSYEQSQRGRVFDAFDSTKPQHVWDHEAVIGPIGAHESPSAYRQRYLRAALQPDLPVVCGWDFGVGNPTSLVLGQVEDDSLMRIRWLDSEESSDEGWTYFHAFLYGLWAPIVKEVTGLDILHYGDPAGKGRDSELKSWIKNLGMATPRVMIVHAPKVGSLLAWVDFIADLIRRDQFVVSRYATDILDMMGQYHFPLDKDGVPVPGTHLPEKDEFSHRADALRYVYMFRYHTRLMRVNSPTNEMAARALSIGRGSRTERREF